MTEKVEIDVNSKELDAHVGEQDAVKLREDLELVDGVYPTFNVEEYREASVAPVFSDQHLTISECRNYSIASWR